LLLVPLAWPLAAQGHGPAGHRPAGPAEQQAWGIAGEPGAVRRTVERISIPLTVGGGIRTVDDIQALLTNQIRALTSDQVSNISTDQIGNLTTSQLAALTTAQTSALSSGQIESMTSDQLGALPF
jgi:hypothetical protein